MNNLGNTIEDVYAWKITINFSDNLDKNDSRYRMFLSLVAKYRIQFQLAPKGDTNIVMDHVSTNNKNKVLNWLYSIFEADFDDIIIEINCELIPQRKTSNE